MCFRAIHFNVNCRAFSGPNPRIFIPSCGERHCSLQTQITIRSFTSNAGRFERQCDTVGLFVRNTDSEFPPLFVPVVRARPLLNRTHRHITRG